MTDVRTYDPNLVTVSVNGIALVGFSDGALVQCSKDNDSFTTKVSAQGSVGVAINNNNLGTIKVTLMQTSPSVTYLNQLAKSKTPFPIWVTSANDIKEKFGGTQALIKQPADSKFSNAVEDREFDFTVFDYNAS
ncbi:phage structural protein [Sporolactobacillus pectinivorans]|uniref:phage structural protein n=1 Tax=Sporolactobacillus pectinivorans TaxID=1591408 RepID=UPI000C26539B|nr:phage protein [Sporolactobacillus pectinivorans]